MLSMSAWASPQGDVARGWYLWRTGQDEAAYALARSVVDDHPTSYAAHEFAIAMGVDQGDGASLEAHYRHRWGLEPAAPLGRVTLATVLSLRNPGKGRWCDEVTALLRPVVSGEDHYWATRTERIQEQRCSGTTDHADAELRRIAKEGGVGWDDGVLAKLDAGYMKPDMPDEVERLWAEFPHRLDKAHLVWADGVSGPARGRIRTLTSRALSDAVEGDEPSLVHAAMVAYLQAEKDKRAQAARERLGALDPAADLDVRRSLADIEDPPIYAQIDACNGQIGPYKVLDCLEDVEDVPESGSIAAYYLMKMRLAYRAVDKPERALRAGTEAWLADRDHRYNARTFATDLLEWDGEVTPEQWALAVEAVNVAFGDRIPEDPAAVEGERARRILAKDLDVWSEVHRRAGMAEEALAVQLDALLLEDTPRRRLQLGRVLADAGRQDDAVLQLVHGIHYEQTDTGAIAEARRLLDAVAGSWHPRGLPGMMREIAWAPGQRATSHPLVGRRLEAVEALAAPVVEVPEGEEPPVVRARVIMTWAPFAPESTSALERLHGLAEAVAGRGVVFQTVDVGLEPTEVPDTHTLPNTFGGAAVMRLFRAVAPPTVVVLDGRDRVRGVLAGWHWDELDLENLLDTVAP